MFNPHRPRRVAFGLVLCCSGALLTACSRDSTASSATTSAALTSTESATASTAAGDAADAASDTSVATSVLPPTAAAASTTTSPAEGSQPAAPPASQAPASQNESSAPDQGDSITYDHPDLGPVTISITYPNADDADHSYPAVRATVDATGESVFEWTNTDGVRIFDFAGRQFNPDIENPVDKRGHVFFEYDPGRSHGISYLIPTATGFDSNGTLGDSYQDGVYDADLVDSDGDGNYEIDKHFQNCDPSCGDGYIYSHIWTWDGSTYSGSDADPGPDKADHVGDPAMLEPAKAAFNNYLLAAGAREYKKAWNMLEPSYQDKYGGYDKFTAFWDRIDSVGVELLLPSERDESTTQLDGTLWYQLKDGTRQNESVTVVMSNGNPPKVLDYEAYALKE